MKIVSDKIYNDTIKRVNKLIQIDSNPIKYKQKILINLIPTFAFKQLVVFIRLGEYLKAQGFWVDYFGCNGIFNHCDMVKMNDEVDRKLICERCKKAYKQLKLPFIKYHLNNSKKYDKQYLKNAMVRFCGTDVKFKQYKKECKQNLKISTKLEYNYDWIISLNHFENYSIAPFIQQFKNRLIVGLNQTDEIYLFQNSRDLIFKQKLRFDKEKEEKIEAYLKNRIKFTNKFELKTKKKVVSFFPNIMEDAFEDTNNVVFNSMIDWLKESIDYLLKRDFFIIIKAHPAEVTWKPTKSVLDYIENNPNILKIKANSDINTYDIIKKSDFISIYNGTIFYESLVMDKNIVIGGKIGDIYHKTKKEYFNQFKNYKKYDYKKGLEYAYKILFTKSFKLNMIDTKLPYPHIKKDVKKEPSFQAIKDIIENKYDVNKYIKYFTPLY